MSGVVNLDTLDLAALIRHLPQASSLDLYRLQYVIEALLNEPRRILEIRQRLHAGMTVRFFSFPEAAFLTARITALGTRAVTLEEIDRRLRHTGVPYAALDLQSAPPSGPDVFGTAKQSEPTKPRGLARADFKIGESVSFTDRQLDTIIGRIVRLNQKTASVESDRGPWRVSYALLQHVIDV
ncbi:MAG TPA: hypothetical protein VHJ99_14055 [Candidatus Dormibacteraeota bacterium]|nr:hypothetical protein [Candidatus Dormibacteraeota bacterium]